VTKPTVAPLENFTNVFSRPAVTDHCDAGMKRLADEPSVA